MTLAIEQEIGISNHRHTTTGIEVGSLALLYSYHEATPITSPPWHTGFETDHQKSEVYQPSGFYNQLKLELQTQPLRAFETGALICRNEIWELWQQPDGQFIFTNPMQSQKRQVIIDPNFRGGKILGDFYAQNPCYPLPQDLEIVLFVNWLAKYHDVLLHASGVAYAGLGYVFCAESGAGKSTLAAALSNKEGVTVLGEDQVLLRYLDGRFWIFGSPWHENRNLCSQLGVPLKALFFLEKNGISLLEPIRALEAVTRLLQTAFIPYYRPNSVNGILERLAYLAELLPMFRLSYPIGSDVFSMILNPPSQAVNRVISGQADKEV